ncbi:hypothetical protein SM8_032095 [Streptomyces sp. SM8]|nr:hypothetical protein SM8_032095 [Streptomyces sp. SM8]
MLKARKIQPVIRAGSARLGWVRLSHSIARQYSHPAAKTQPMPYATTVGTSEDSSPPMLAVVATIATAVKPTATPMAPRRMSASQSRGGSGTQASYSTVRVDARPPMTVVS